jgi:hypothetical protein
MCRLPAVSIPDFDLIQVLDLIVVSSAWAHRTLIVRKLKGLEDIICEWYYKFEPVKASLIVVRSDDNRISDGRRRRLAICFRRSVSWS